MRTPPPAAETHAGAHRPQVLADLANAVQGNVLGLMFGNVGVALVAAWMFRDAAPRPVVATWLLLQVVNGAFNAWAGHRVGRRPAHAGNAPRRLRHATVASTLTGALWGVGVLLFWVPERLDLQVLLLFFVAGMTSGALHALVGWLPAYFGFTLPYVAAVLGVTAWHGGLVNAIILVIGVIYTATNARFAGNMHRMLFNSLSQRHEIVELAAYLKQQKERAEEASVAKSRFLAAASHDLRQPMHALSLFVGAMGHQPMGTEALRLLGHVRSAVESMQAMFNALLDMSRLDAGIVRANARPFDLRPMLDRVAGDEGALARDKGIGLRLNAPAALMVCSDPLLLERILRNLVSNAVRYTPSGGVLLAARPRGGCALLRVIDTGIGIAPDRQAEVFEEFVQIDNPERDRTKGLGLGLAIVRRLTELMGMPLMLRSAPGRGTVFALQVPLAETSQAMIDPLQGGEASTSDAAAARPVSPAPWVVVVDDDDEIRAAVHVLLSTWGYTVCDGASVDEVLAKIEILPVVPRLIIADYRLRGTETGLDAVARMQSEYNETIPSILVTGDTAPERLQEAARSGCVLLHKPVEPQVLRAAIERVLAGAVPPLQYGIGGSPGT